MRHFYIKLFLVLTFIVSFTVNLLSQSTVSTTINYSGGLGQGGCAVCGNDYWCINNPPAPNNGMIGQSAPAIEQTFFDPVPAGSIITNVTVQYWTASCYGAEIYGTFATSSSNSFVFPVANDGNAGCACSSNPCALTTSSSVSYPCGIPGYVYGGNNIFRLSASAPMCINRAVLVFSYYPANSLVPTISSSGTLCGGVGNVNLTASNGFASYHWSNGSWSQSISVSSPGTYVVTVTTVSGCNTITASATVVDNPIPSASASNTGPVCEGSSVTVSALPSGMTYNWSGPSGPMGNLQSYTGNATMSQAGIYYVTVTGAGGCTNTASTTLTVNPVPANDNCVNATIIGGVPYNSGVLPNNCATDDIPASSGCGSYSSNVWYRVTGTGQQMTASTNNAGTNFDTEIHVYSGSCGSFTEVACDDDGGSSNRSIASWCSLAGTTYYISVGHFSTTGGFGNYELTVSDMPVSAPTSVSASPNPICSGQSTTLTGTVGSGQEQQ